MWSKTFGVHDQLKKYTMHVYESQVAKNFTKYDQKPWTEFLPETQIQTERKKKFVVQNKIIYLTSD
jgi:hypothetical protein